MKDYLNEIPIFFAVDNEYVPFLVVTIQSIIDNLTENNKYELKIMYINLSKENMKKIQKYERHNVHIEFININNYLEHIKNKLYTRNYFSNTTYFRLFIPNLYSQYNKAIYLDCDTIVLTDIAKLYNIDIGNNLVAGVSDGAVQTVEVFQEYVEKVIGVYDYNNYFNAGVLILNLEELRKYNFQEKFLYLLEKVKYEVAQDQDYLNRLCKGRVKLLDPSWNKMPIMGEDNKDKKIIHFNLGFKPWFFDNVLYQEYFWEYAKKTDFYEKIKKLSSSYSEEDKIRDDANSSKLMDLAQKEADCVGDDRKKINIEYNQMSIQKSKERLEILKKIEKLEEEGKFDVDAENDPPTIPLTPDNVDYLHKKSSSKIKNKIANSFGLMYLKNIIKEQKLIIKDIKGIENLNKVTTGAMITCNHFNPIDCFAVERVFLNSAQRKKKKLYKVIREGNYTNFPGLYGFLFRNCDTLPLSSLQSTMSKFLTAVNTILKKGDFILMYPEQSLWWNYKKPKPLKPGTFKLAVKNNVPVIPIFITMKDSDKIGEDGFPIQEYYVHIEEPIYPDLKLSVKENIEMMMQKNYSIWKNIYENFYGIELEYTTKGMADK